MGLLIKNAIITLPFTLTSILFIQTLSPMVISYRSKEKSREVARHKALRAMNIAFGILFVVVFFYAVSPSRWRWAMMKRLKPMSRTSRRWRLPRSLSTAARVHG
jgi:hypothetical protein